MGFIARLFIFILIIIIFIIVSIIYNTNNSSINFNNIEISSINEVIDGDTIILETNEKVRLLGINTPEKSKPYYNEAKNFLNQFKDDNIYLKKDKEDNDRYNRKLRYIFKDSRFINVEILENGLATTLMIDNLIYEEKFKKAEKFARDNKIGLWKLSSDICSNCIKLIELNSKDDFFIIKNSCEFTCNMTGWFVKDDSNHFTYLTPLNPYQQKIYQSKTKIWNDDKDRFFMRDSNGLLVIFYPYP
ncbi:MAG: thermonuclease family protein [Candidatus Pacearchaeota archaeon]|jgi:micrococcal nuclease